MINLGPQYYRPPFPVSSFWKEDIQKIKDSGFNCLQLWIMWSWVESKPGKFDFGDYDRIIDYAEASGLNVVLSTIAEVHPYWIHRVIPDCELITNLGHKVISEHRNECHNGLTPGGCFDHPEVWKRMSGFIQETAVHYKNRKNIAGWDAWNELRWNVQADGPVCYCQHTVKRYREWLESRFGSLDGLNKEWIRRYDSWEDVLPGKTTSRPYTSTMSFADFLTWRSSQHAEDRYKIIKAVHPDKMVTAHGPSPCMTVVGEGELNQAMNRGNDWSIADKLDGIGCSNFPTWWKMKNADYSLTMEMIHSAARGKKFWVSELQGGRSNIGFEVSDPVRAVDQQRWIWNSIACGADTVLLWCWRDEIFGCESNGFGFIGNDGFADERITAMQHTGKILEKHPELLENYKPAKSEVAVMFSPQTYYLYWAQESEARKPLNSIRGFCLAMIRNSVPFKIVEENHLE
jgi:beta-galactosidase